LEEKSVSTYILNIYNSCTGEYEDVPVSEAVYNEYKRSGWRMEKNDASYFDHEIQFSQLIGGDDGAYQKGYKYITTVQDLETGEIIWAHDGYGDEILKLYFGSLTPEQCAGIEFVVADGARWITRQVEEFCPNAKRCVDPFHVVGWATDALDAARKRLSDDAKKNDSPS
jgi:transposase